jgi:hypothetical protein
MSSLVTVIRIIEKNDRLTKWYIRTFASEILHSVILNSIDEIQTAFLLLAMALDLTEEYRWSTPIIDAVRGITDLSLEAALDLNPGSVDDRDITGQSALHWAARRGDIKAVRTLLSFGASLSAKDLCWNTPLHAALYSYAPSIASILLEAGSDPHARNRHGTTPLHRAVRTGSEETVLDLLHRGADANAVDNRARDCFYHAGLA